MKVSFPPAHLLAATVVATAVLWTGCASTSVKSTWKSPDYHGGPVQKVAILAVEDRGLVRSGIENRFANQLNSQGQSAFATYEMLGLAATKANREEAATKLRQAGADSVLLVRLVDSSLRSAEVRQTHQAFVPYATGFANDGWYDCFTVAFMDMSVVRGSTRQNLYLDIGLFDLSTGKRLWNCVTDTLVREDSNRLEVVDAFVAKVVATLRKDGLVR
jgi:hypothetical protein